MLVVAFFAPLVMAALSSIVAFIIATTPPSLALGANLLTIIVSCVFLYDRFYERKHRPKNG